VSLSPASIRVVACVISRDGRFLITQRKKESHLGHLWEFPGGKIEPGESPQQCAVRECREEIGVEVKAGETIEEVRHDYPELRVHLYFIKCELISGEPRPLDCADLTWARPEEFSRFRFPEADRGIIERYIRVSDKVPGQGC
jgi:mutator protein MutT